jgi:hypothetical protein
VVLLRALREQYLDAFAEGTMSIQRFRSLRATNPLRCETCSRVFISVGNDVTEPSCPCGGYLIPRALEANLYEVFIAKSETLATLGQSIEATASPGLSMEVDVGYGASHGYDATHGGPTGPGDAPAKT